MNTMTDDDSEDHLVLLVGDIRRRMAELKAGAQPIAKSKPTPEQLRQRNATIMAKAVDMCREGQITAADVARLQAFCQQVEALDVT